MTFLHPCGPKDTVPFKILVSPISTITGISLFIELSLAMMFVSFFSAVLGFLYLFCSLWKMSHPTDSFASQKQHEVTLKSIKKVRNKKSPCVIA